MAPDVFPDRAALMAAAAARLGKSLERAIASRGAGVAALSGGTTPESAYARLAAHALDWPRVTFLLVDERFVPLAHPGSNEAMLRRALAPALAAGAVLAPMSAPNLTLDEAADVADAAYRGHSIDIALMGVGADGHTASWFAGADGLDAALDPGNSRTVVALRASQASGSAERLSLTRAAVTRAGRVLLLLQGEDKRAALAAALRAPATQASVAALFADPARPPEVLWSA